MELKERPDGPKTEIGKKLDKINRGMREKIVGELNGYGFTQTDIIEILSILTSIAGVYYKLAVDILYSNLPDKLEKEAKEVVLGGIEDVYKKDIYSMVSKVAKVKRESQGKTKKMEAKMKIDTTEYDELLLDVIFQACEDNGKIDNQCISAYEEACDYLASKGMIKTRNGRIYEIVSRYNTV